MKLFVLWCHMQSFVQIKFYLLWFDFFCGGFASNLPPYFLYLPVLCVRLSSRRFLQSQRILSEGPAEETVRGAICNSLTSPHVPVAWTPCNYWSSNSSAGNEPSRRGHSWDLGWQRRLQVSWPWPRWLMGTIRLPNQGESERLDWKPDSDPEFEAESQFMLWLGNGIKI